MTLHLRTLALPALVLSASWPALAQNADRTPAPPQPTAGSAASPAQAAYPVPADSARLEVIKAPRPDYPPEAAAARLEGRVWIQLHISENGDVDSCEILGGDPILAKAAENAMRQWKFKPFIKDGKPVRVSRKVPFDFFLKDRDRDPCAGVEGIVAMNRGDHPAQVDQAAMEGSLIHKVNPAYPLLARTKHVQGTVILQAAIGRDGRIHNLQALCGPPELIPASIEAVKQWRYRPYTVDGKPVEVETTVKVQFHM